MDPPSDPPPPLLSQLQPPPPFAVPPPNLPGSAVNGADHGVKRRGRPPKAKVDTIQAAVPVFPPAVDINVPVADVPISPVKGRGRSPKKTVGKRGRGRPPKIGVSRVPTPGSVSRGRGRPKKNTRGRPPRPVVEAAPAAASGALPVFGGGVATPVGVKRRGRPPKAGGVTKKPRKLSGKPVGRPRKAPDSHLLVAYLDLKAKLENLQSRVKQTATLVRPYLNNNEAAINALQELEFAATNVNVSSYSESQQAAQF